MVERDWIYLVDYIACISALFSLRKHAYSNILKILPPKNENFQIKKRGGSNEYLQSMFLSRNKKNNVYTPVNPSFTI